MKDKITRINVRCPQAVYKKAISAKKETGLSINNLFVLALTQLLNAGKGAKIPKNLTLPSNELPEL